MQLRALIVNQQDIGACEPVHAAHQAAVAGLEGLLQRYRVDAREFDDGASGPQPRPGLVFILTPMTCWYPGLRALVESARQPDARTPVILIETASTLSLRHALETSGADYVHRGQLGEELGFILQTFGYRLKRH